MDIQARSEMCCDIIGATKDGDLLSPFELKLVEDGINGFLNVQGYKALEDLHKSILIDKTFIPYNERSFRGIKHLTADSKGAGGGLWINWKGKNIEHYNTPFAYSDEGLEELKELERRCLSLEGRNIDVDISTVIWNWEEEIPI